MDRQGELPKSECLKPKVKKTPSVNMLPQVGNSDLHSRHEESHGIQWRWKRV